MEGGARHRVECEIEGEVEQDENKRKRWEIISKLSLHFDF